MDKFPALHKWNNMSDPKYKFTAGINHETCNKKSLYFEGIGNKYFHFQTYTFYNLY